MTNPAPNPTSIATVSLSGDLAEKLQAIAAAGFDAVEVFAAVRQWKDGFR